MTLASHPTAPATAAILADEPAQRLQSISGLADQIHQLQLENVARLSANDRLLGTCREVLSAMESSVHQGQTEGLLAAIQQLRAVISEESR